MNNRRLTAPTRLGSALPLVLVTIGCAPPEAAEHSTEAWETQLAGAVQAPPTEVGLSADGPVKWGESTTWTVTGLDPSTEVYLLGSPSLSSAGGVCPASLDGWCVDLDGGSLRILDSTFPNFDGEATLTSSLPATPVAGMDDFVVQAVQEGLDSSVSNVVIEGIGDSPPFYDGPAAIASADLGCDVAGWHLEASVAGWASDAVVNIWETGHVYGWNEEHALALDSYDEGGRWEERHTVLSDSAYLSEQFTGRSTVFTCGVHDDYTVSARIYDESGTMSGCWMWGHDPGMVKSGDFVEYGHTSSPDELADCRELPSL